MLFSNISSFNLEDYKNIQEAADFLSKFDEKNFVVGRFQRKDKPFFYQCLEYNTESINNFEFEIHKKCLDLHYIVEGEECIDISSDSSYAAISNYDNSRDIQYVQTPKCVQRISLHQGDFVLIGMQEPHRTNGVVDSSVHVKKIVLKVNR